MTFTQIFRAEAVNPNTGDVVQNIRVRADNGQTYKLLNSFEELKAHGTMQEVLESLEIKPGQYGDYAQLPKYKKLEDVSW